MSYAENKFFAKNRTLNKEYYKSLLSCTENHILRLCLNHLLQLSNNLSINELDGNKDRLIEIFKNEVNIYGLQIIPRVYELLLNHCPSASIVQFTKSTKITNSREILSAFIYQKSIDNLTNKILKIVHTNPEPDTFKNLLFLLDDIIFGLKEVDSLTVDKRRIESSLQKILEKFYFQKKPTQIGYVLDFLTLIVEDSKYFNKSRLKKILRKIFEYYKKHRKRVKNFNYKANVLTAGKYKTNEINKTKFYKVLLKRRINS